MTVKSSISLTDDQYAFVRKLVESGRFSSVSAVLQQGLDALKRDMDDQMAEREALKELLAQRRRGSFIGAAEMDDRIEAMIAAKRSHGVSS